MNKNRILYVCLGLALLMMFFSACTPPYYTESEKQAVEETSRRILTEWLDTLPESYELTSVSMVRGTEPGKNPHVGYYRSNFSHGSFQAGGRDCRAVVNNEDGTIWTDLYQIDLGPYIHDALLPYCEAHGFTEDFLVKRAEINYLLRSHDSRDRSGATMDVDVLFSGMLPADITPENADETVPQFLHDQWLCRFDVYYAAEEAAGFDPEILAEYLAETGNYNSTQDQEYMIIHVTPEYYAALLKHTEAGDEEPDNVVPETAMYGNGSYGTLIISEDAAKPYYIFWKYQHTEQDGIIVEYVEQYYEGTLAEFDPNTLEVMPSPVKYDDGRIIISGSSNYRGSLYFREKPAFTGAWRSYPDDEKKKEPEELFVQELFGSSDLGGPFWSLNTEDNRYPAGYEFIPMYKEILVFE